MTAKLIIEELLHNENLKQIDLANLLNESQQNFNKKLRNDTFKYTDMENIAKLLDYKISWEKIGVIKLPSIQKEMLDIFNKIPLEEQYKLIGRLEEIASKYDNKEVGKSSSSKIG
jgi:hypothetical protein